MAGFASAGPGVQVELGCASPASWTSRRARCSRASWTRLWTQAKKTCTSISPGSDSSISPRRASSTSVPASSRRPAAASCFITLRRSRGACSRCWTRTRQRLRPEPPEQRARVRDGKALPVVVEVDENLGVATPTRDPPCPLVELRLRVVAAPPPVTMVQAHQRPVRGELAGLERPLRVVGYHERGLVLAEQCV